MSSLKHWDKYLMIGMDKNGRNGEIYYRLLGFKLGFWLGLIEISEFVANEVSLVNYVSYI